jgi:hypothetical protein
VRENPIYIFRGNITSAGVNPVPAYLSITDCYFRNNNTSGMTHVLHPAILFGGVAATVKISGCHFYDDQAVKTQYYPIAFNGGASDGITILGCLLAAYGTGASIGLTGGATVTNGKLYGCMGLTGIPAGFTTV